MRRISSQWIVPVGFALLLGVAGRGEAGGFLHKCNTDCNSEVVELPAQKIVVHTARPQVVVEETRLTHGGLRLQAAPMAFAAPTPYVATFFTPMVPTGHALFSSSNDGLESLGDEDAIVRSSHNVQLSYLHYMNARAAHDRQVAISRAVTDTIDRLDAAQKAPADLTTPKACDCSGIQKQLDDIKASITDINKKIDRLEQYVNLHDEFLKEQIKAGLLKPGAPPVKTGDSKSSD